MDQFFDFFIISSKTSSYKSVEELRSTDEPVADIIDANYFLSTWYSSSKDRYPKDSSLPFEVNV